MKDSRMRAGARWGGASWIADRQGGLASTGRARGVAGGTHWSGAGRGGAGQGGLASLVCSHLQCATVIESRAISI